MKLFVVFGLIAVTFSLVHAQDGCDCASQIDEHLRPVIDQRDMYRRDVDTLLKQREELTRERDELFHTREQVIKERDTYFHEKEEILRIHGASVEMKRQLDEHREAVSQLEIEKRRLIEEVNAQKSIAEKSIADREHFQKVAQENQHYMQEYKVRLATMRDKSAKLDVELENAYSKIKELESATLITKIKSELAAGYESLLMLMGKHKEETSQDL